MEREYRDKNGKAMTKEEVELLPSEELSERSAIAINIVADADSLYDAIADVMIETIERKKGKKVTMILPVGPVGQYPVFARKIKEHGIDCRNLWTFNMDEFLDRNGKTIAQSHPLSFKRIMMETFFEQIPADLRMPIEQTFFPRHDYIDEMDRMLDQHAGDGVDLCLAGIGPEGHFAFNEDPNFRHVEVSMEEFLDDRTRLVMVNTSTVDMDSLVAGSGDRSSIPPFAVTIGPHDILRAKRVEVIFYAGKFQRYALRQMLFRTPTERFPGTLLKLRKKTDGTVVPREALTIWSTQREADIVRIQTVL
ncbi:MAG: 6-phosphogluconolactonase [Planctomycetota bacterium]|jgi:glucosamine-6-phosphate deaminase